MSKIQFDMLELPTEEEIYPEVFEDEPHPLKDEEWLDEVEYLLNDLENAAHRLKREMRTLTQTTPVLRRLIYMRNLIIRYGSHTTECAYMKIDTPRLGEEYSTCDCGWYELKMKLKRKRYY